MLQKQILINNCNMYLAHRRKHIYLFFFFFTGFTVTRVENRMRKYIYTFTNTCRFHVHRCIYREPVINMLFPCLSFFATGRNETFCCAESEKYIKAALVPGMHSNTISIAVINGQECSETLHCCAVVRQHDCWPCCSSCLVAFL